MTNYIVFSLVAAMGSFGGLAGHERRGSHGAPGRSALLGLLGAALGIRREDGPGQAELNRWQTAVGVLNDGPTLQDFHTVQTVPSANIKAPATRADALRALKPSDNAVITRRDYRMDCVFAVAIWADAAQSELEALIDALKRPQFTPYLGRKSCPLAAPMAPRLVSANSVPEALAQAQLPGWLPPLPLLRILSDQASDGAVEETFWDQPLDRQAWHFGPRTVFVSQHSPKEHALPEE